MSPVAPLIQYQLEPNLSVEEFQEILVRSTLAERRPIEDHARLQTMLRHADVIVTARVAGLLVGISRAITDRAYCTYLSDLAVDVAFQKQGIGRELMRLTHESAGVMTTLVLLSAPQAVSYYPHVGLIRHDSCWTIPARTSGNSLPDTSKLAHHENRPTP